MKTSLQLLSHYACILAVAGVVLLANLGKARLWDRDEPRNAGCAREMLQRGDWVVPYFNGELRTAKPVLLYWLIMSAYTVLGESEFAARLPSALLGIGTVLATYHIGRRLFDSSAALIGALALATCLMFDVAARAATPDAALIFFGTMAIWAFVHGTFQPRSMHNLEHAPRLQSPERFFPTAWPAVAVVFAMMGLAVLAKGPVGLVLPTAVIGMFLLIVRLNPSRWSGAALSRDNAACTDTNDPIDDQETLIDYALPASARSATTDTSSPPFLGRITSFLRMLLRPFAPRHFLATCWAMRPITAIAVVLAVALPWYLWVGFRTDGQFLHEFFFKEHVGRATSSFENHDGGPLFYVATILVGTFPWSVFAAPVLLHVVGAIRRRDGWAIGYTFLGCWVGVYLALFTIAQTKLPSYVTPCYPALALMAGCFLRRWTLGTEGVAWHWPRVALAVLALVGIAMLIGLPIAAHRYLPGEEGFAAIGLIPLLGAAVAWGLMESGRRRTTVAALSLTGTVFALVLFGYATVRVDRHQKSHLLLTAIERRSDNPHIAAIGVMESSWVFYAGRPIELLPLPAHDAHAAPAHSMYVSHGTRESSPKEFASHGARDMSPEQFVSHSGTRVATDDRPFACELATYFAAPGDRFLITTQSMLPRLEGHLPLDVGVIAEAPYFLKDETLVVLGRTTLVAAASAARPTRR